MILRMQFPDCGHHPAVGRVYNNPIRIPWEIWSIRNILKQFTLNVSVGENC